MRGSHSCGAALTHPCCPATRSSPGPGRSELPQGLSAGSLLPQPLTAGPGANLWEGAVPDGHEAEDRKTHFLLSALFHALDSSAQSPGPRPTLHLAEHQLP